MAQKQLSYYPLHNLLQIEFNSIYNHIHMGEVFSCESESKKQFTAKMQKKITSQRNEIRKMDKLLTRQKNSFHQKERVYREKISKLQCHIKKKDIQTAALKQIRQKLLLILSRKIIEHRKQIQSFQEIDEHREYNREAHHSSVEHYHRQLIKKQEQIQQLTAKFKQLQLYDTSIQRIKDSSEQLIREIIAEVENMQDQQKYKQQNQNQQEILNISRKFSSLIQEQQQIIAQITIQHSPIKTQLIEVCTSCTSFDTQSIQNLQQLNKMSQSQRFLENTTKLRQINHELCSISRQRLSKVSETKRHTLNDLKAKLSRYVQQLQRLKNPQKITIKQQNRKQFEVSSLCPEKQQVYHCRR